MLEAAFGDNVVDGGDALCMQFPGDFLDQLDFACGKTVTC